MPCLHERTQPAADDGSEILKPKRRYRNSVINIPVLCERCEKPLPCSCPHYQGTDDDLPINLWEEPEL